MSDQLSFIELDAPPPARLTDRLFYAVFPDANTAAHIARLAAHLRGEYGLKGRPLAEDRFHITLHHLGDYVGEPPRELVAAAHEAASEVTALPIEVNFDRAISFRRSHKAPLVLRGGDGVAQLMAFQQALGATMMRTGLGNFVQQRFTPHVTLLYDDHIVPEQAVEIISWTVREFVLVRSLLGQTRHIPLGRWPLLG